jgi:ATP-dependent RNA helicase RhlE
MRHTFSNNPRHQGRNARGIRALAPKIKKIPGSDIDIAKFTNKAVAPAEQEVFVPVHRFSDFGFDPRIQRNLDAKGYQFPTPIQDGALKPVMEGYDLIGLANTGTGKTAAFLLPIIQRYLSGHDGGSLIIVPTRELATQIEDEFDAFAKGLGLRAVVCVGGMSMHKQIAGIKKGPHLVIGTPGRLKDLINQDILYLGGCTTLVLDEADRMVDMGFIKDIRFILSHLPEQKQSLCFSATMTKEIEELVNGLLKNPTKISVRTRETSGHVEQEVIKVVSQDHKIEQLESMLAKPEFNKVLVFGATKWGVQKLAKRLEQRGFKVADIHGNKTQPQRQKALNAFKEEKIQALIATDVAARGLDIPNVSHVINFDIPQTYEEYVHRIGRTGRAGNTGNAITFVLEH